jgi:hypothetical protein
MHNSWWISTGIVFLSWRKQITAQISQLVGLFIAGHIITHSVETRTNTRWPVMWWFTRQWVMWCYLACASFPLPKINRGYLPNSLHICNNILRGSVVGWGAMLQAGWSRVQVLMRSLDFFNRSNPSSRTMALWSTQPLTEMSTRNLPGE